jgi:RNA polymerase sigma-70 factor, ECF subfamily
MTETEEFEQFMRDYQNMVFTTAVRLLASEAEAQDISQEVFLKAYERFRELKESGTAGGWLKRVTTNLCLNHLSRYRKRWHFFSEFFTGAEEDQERQMELVVDEFDGKGELNAAEERVILEEALLKLPPNQRVPLVLYHFEELSYEEIAATLKISLSKVKTDIMRGREALKKKLLQGSTAGKELAAEYEAKSPAPFRHLNCLMSPTLL